MKNNYLFPYSENRHWHFSWTLLGTTAKWTWDSSKKTESTFRTRFKWVQDWDSAYCKASTHELSETFGMLHWRRREDIDLRIHVKQKLGLLHLWHVIENPCTNNSSLLIFSFKLRYLYNYLIVIWCRYNKRSITKLDQKTSYNWRDSSRTAVPPQALTPSGHTQGPQSKQYSLRRSYEPQNIWFWPCPDIWIKWNPCKYKQGCGDAVRS